MKSKIIQEKIKFEELFETPLRNGLFRPSHTRGSGIKMVNMKEIFANNRINSISMEKVPMNDDEKRKFLLQEGDLLFARQSLVYEGTGKCVLVTNSIDPLTFESHIIRARLNAKLADSRFYYYFFNSRIGRQTILSIVEQTAASGIRGNDLKQLMVTFFPIDYQKKIADIFESIENLIDNLQNQNKVLEQIAQVIFKSWFVDFDGITEFEDSEIGKIPKGWKIEKLINRISVTYGYPFKSELFNLEKGTPVIRIRNLDDNFSKTLTTEICDNRYHVYPGDILIGMDGEFNASMWLGGESLLNQRICKLFTKNESFGSYFILFLIKQKFKEYEQKISGTTVSHLSKKDVEELNLLFPVNEFLKKYNDFVKPIFQKLIKNFSEIQTNKYLFNILLPKLMSGEIRV